MSDAIMVALISGAVSLIISFGSKWLDKKNGLAKDIEEINESLTEIKNSVTVLKQNDEKNGDMIYQMLDHLSTNNNTGGMKKALDDYNQYYRHS